MNIHETVFYHIYPLGAFGAPKQNGGGPVEARLSRVLDWVPSMKAVGATALYLGPVFESESHGYDTLDYAVVDRRLGTNSDLAELSRALKGEGISLVLDGVFNHVSRNHPIVRDVAAMGPASTYASWIAGYDPSRQQGGLPFGYRTWAGHDTLVGLDTGNPGVQDSLICHALQWIEDFAIEGLRLDAANCLDRGFLRELARRCREKRPGFLLVGEAMSGEEARSLIEEGHLDSATNYEAFKSLWSSWNDVNYHELSWTMKRLFGEGGLCRGKQLYSFADNHDVDRVASTLTGSTGLYPLYGLLYSMPGVPSVYYGSEYGVKGQKAGWDDGPLRPELFPTALAANPPEPGLLPAIQRFAATRRTSAAVKYGSYRELQVLQGGMAFAREASPSELAVIAVNGTAKPLPFTVRPGNPMGARFRDRLDPGYTVAVDAKGKLLVTVPPNWIRWLELSNAP